MLIFLSFLFLSFFLFLIFFFFFLQRLDYANVDTNMSFQLNLRVHNNIWYWYKYEDIWFCCCCLFCFLLSRVGLLSLILCTVVVWWRSVDFALQQARSAWSHRDNRHDGDRQLVHPLGCPTGVSASEYSLTWDVSKPSFGNSVSSTPSPLSQFTLFHPSLFPSSYLFLSFPIFAPVLSEYRIWCVCVCVFRRLLICFVCVTKN